MSAAIPFLAVALATPGQAVPGAGTPASPDIRGIVPPQPYFVNASPWLLVLAAVCVLLALLVAWYFIFRPAAPKPGPQLTPRERAEQRLRELAARADALDPRAFGNEVADVLRAYIGGQFRLHPERQTSQEFLASVSGSRAFTRSEHVLLTDFLEGCDLLKFARADATPERKQFLLSQATDFVRSSAPPPVSATVENGQAGVGRQKAEV